MKKSSYLTRWLVSVFVVSSFTMCAKVMENEQALNPVSDKQSFELITTCSYTVQPNEWFVDGTDVAAGSVVCIPAGIRGSLLLKNFKGTADSPIIIVNKGGKVTFSADVTASYALKTQNCQYFKILGNGDPTVKYGFDINGGNIGLTMDDLSSDFEVSNVEVRNSGFAGIMGKTDPSCDQATWRGHFTMRNIILHDNYVHKTGGEGFYIGNSFYAEGRSLSCGTVLPHDVVNVKIYNNLTDSTGCEGIQVGCAVTGCEIYNNTVKSPGLTPFAAAQNNGIQIGEGTGGKCYNNLVKNAPGNGIIVLGLGDNQVFNNYILNSGAHGIFADTRTTNPGPNFQFVNNTIVAPVLDGIRLYSETIPMNTVINNVIINAGSGTAIYRRSNNVKFTVSNNYINADIGSCKFVNYNIGDFHLQSTSPLIDAGANTSAYSVSFDYFGSARPSGIAFDIGATEYK
jgi:hypothetical protein